MQSEHRLAGLTVEQRTALLDLLITAMYLDGNLASAENTQLRKILSAMGYSTKYDRDKEFDASVTRVRPYVENAKLAREHSARLAQKFNTPESRELVISAIEDFMAHDLPISPTEHAWLSAVKERLTTPT